jgi:glyoxylase-like metal-dependent hydrolase (beta-lactamase superfamily II)
VARRVEHLNCGTLRPAGGRMVCHCLLVETDRRLALVDTGFGLGDVAEPPRRPYARFVTRARLDPDETAARQVERLGYSRADVTDLVLTHLDFDHAGGLRDFPTATVHVLDAEHRAATSPATPIERFRYVARQWSHGPDWITYDSRGGDRWFGFESARELRGLPAMALLPLHGHSRGHAGVALSVGERWLLHAGDAYFARRELDPAGPRAPRRIEAFQTAFQVDGAARRRNRLRLRELAGAHGDRVTIFCSHDPVELERLRT